MQLNKIKMLLQVSDSDGINIQLGCGLQKQDAVNQNKKIM
jgi:hypothetical protein